MKYDILIADDERDICKLISGLLEDEGYQTRIALDSDQIFESIQTRQPSLVILDIWLQNSKMDGLEVLDVIKSFNAILPVIIISGHGTIETAISAIRKGAYDFIEKPFKSDKLLITVRNALKFALLKAENNELKRKFLTKNNLIGQSGLILNLEQKITKIAKSNSRVFITGESGVGKELSARLIHKHSDRSENAFLTVNAASMNPHNIESELFGEENAQGQIQKIGLFEIAHNGILFIDEIGLMPLETQEKLMHVLINQTFKRIRGKKNVYVDVRIISSSTQDIHQLIKQNQFRESLFHRLNVVHLHIPTLKQRREDIPVLFKYFIKEFSELYGSNQKKIMPEALAALQLYHWPGNVRQLRNTAERILILTNEEDHQTIDIKDLPEEILIKKVYDGTGIDHVIGLPLKEARRIFEREYLVNQINRFNGNISKTAQFIGMERSALHRKLKTLNLNSHDDIPEDEMKSG